MEEQNEYEYDPSGPMDTWVRVFYGVLIVFGVVALLAWVLKSDPDRWTYIQTVVLTITLIVVAWNAILTRNMQQAMVQQTNVSILPIIEVIIRLKGEPDPDAELREMTVQQSRLELKNVGQAAALNVKVESLFVKFDYVGYKRRPMKFERLNTILPNQRVVVKDTVPYDVAEARLLGETRPDFFRMLVGKQAKGKHELKIWFTDILGNKYVQVAHTGRDGVWSDAVQSDKGQVMRTTIIYNKKKW